VVVLLPEWAMQREWHRDAAQTRPALSCKGVQPIICTLYR